MIDWLFTNALAALALAAIAGLLIWFCRPSPAVRHALWLVVVLKLVSPTGLMVSLPLPVEHPSVVAEGPKTPAVESSSYMVSEEIITVMVIPGRGQSAEEAAIAAVCPPSPEEPKPTIAPTASTSSTSFDYRPALLGLWAAGAAFIAFRQIRDTVRFARFTRRSQPASPYLIREVAGVANRLNVRLPEVRVLPGLSSPVLWCLWKPVLLWPAGLELRLKGEGRLAVLAHELAHLRRRDHWTRRLEMLAAVLHWWNPLFWVARKKMRADAELACDAWAAGQSDRRAYAEALLEVCSFHPRRRPAPAVGVIGEGRRAMQERLTMIMKDRVPCRLKFGAKLIVALMAVAAVPAWTLGQAAPAAPTGDPQVQAIEEQIKALSQKLEAVKAAKKAEALKAVRERAQIEVRGRAIEAEKVQDFKVESVDLFLTEKPTTTTTAQNVRVLKTGDGGVKVIGADGKEIKDVKVVVVEGANTGGQGVHKTVTVQGVPAAGQTTNKTITLQDVPAAGQTTNKTITLQGVPAAGQSGNKSIVIEAVPGVRLNTTPAVAGHEVKVKPTTVVTQDGKTIVLDVATAKPTTTTKPATATWAFTTADSGSSITLSRATYKIGKDQAAALASLLGAIKATVMETKVDGDNLIVTTTPEAQKTIGQIVGLMKGGSASSTGASYQYKFAPATESQPAVRGVFTPAVPATPATPAVPAAPRAPKPTTPKPAAQSNVVEGVELFELKLDDKNLQEFRLLGDSIELAVPAKPAKASKPAKP